VQPRIDTIFPFAEAAAAHRRILQRQNIGKILLTP
jgi:NADPH:quinone reductase-like Zn-dependent oxidoreductase